VQGVGTVAGFKLYIEDRGGAGLEALYDETKSALGKGNQTRELAGLFSSFDINVPQVNSHVDREKAKTYGLALDDISDTMQVYLGSLYVNDFNRFGRTYQVNVQAESPYRLHAEDIVRLKTRNAAGEMIPLGSVVTVSPSFGPDRVMHYNGYPAAEINGAPAPGYSSGQGEAAMASLLENQLPNSMKFEWTELTYQKILAGNTMMYIFPLSVFLVYLVLAAQYESWTLPLVVILIVPMTLFSAIAGVWLLNGDNNVFTQISLIVLVGLACKNAILIVEFARERQLEGIDPVNAVLEACRLRLRPILMTSLAFTMGVVPLVLSSGAGSEMRQAIGIAVFFGMLGVTAFGLILTPVFYIVVERLVEAVQGRKAETETETELSPVA
jgi:multidrug efflux pump